MDLEAITTMISMYGFPIVMCIVLCWYVATENTKHREELDEIHIKHQQEMKDITQALNNNTLALQHLVDYMSKEGVKNE